MASANIPTIHLNLCIYIPHGAIAPGGQGLRNIEAFHLALLIPLGFFTSHEVYNHIQGVPHFNERKHALQNALQNRGLALVL